MKTPRQLFLALFAAASLAAPAVSHAETVFERFAPPLPPILVPQVVIRSGAPEYRGYDGPPPRREPYYEYRRPREYHHHHYYHEDYRYRDDRPGRGPGPHDRRWR